MNRKMPKPEVFNRNKPNVMQLLPIGATGGKQATTGTEVIPAISLPYWDMEKISLFICYSSQGTLFTEFYKFKDRIELIDFYISNKNRIQNLIKLISLIKKYNINLIHTHGPVYTDFIATLAAKCEGIPNIVSRHVPVSDLVLPFGKKKLFFLIDSVTKKYATVLTSISDYETSVLIKEGCPRNKIHTIYNGVDQNRFNPEVPPAASVFPEGDWDLKLIMVGQMISRKRFDIVIRAIAKGVNLGKKWAAIFVGDGSHRQSYENLSKELTTEQNIRFVGFRKDLPELMKASDVQVLVSEAEGVPMSLLEGMACGVSAIASDIGGVREIFIDGKSGILLKRLDVDELFEALCCMEDIHFRSRAEKVTLERVAPLFTVEKMVQEYQDIYLETAVINPCS